MTMGARRKSSPFSRASGQPPDSCDSGYSRSRVRVHARIPEPKTSRLLLLAEAPKKEANLSGPASLPLPQIGRKSLSLCGPLELRENPRWRRGRLSHPADFRARMVELVRAGRTLEKLSCQDGHTEDLRWSCPSGPSASRCGIAASWRPTYTACAAPFERRHAGHGVPARDAPRRPGAAPAGHGGLHQIAPPGESASIS